MKSRFLVLSILAFVLAVSGLAMADPTATFNYPAGASYGGYYTQTYNVTVTGLGTPYDGTSDVWCDTFGNDITDGQHWTVTGENLTGGNVSGALFGSQPNALKEYEEAGYLMFKYPAIPETNAVIWDIFESGSIGLSGTGTAEWADAAAHAWVGDLKGLYAITPTDGNQGYGGVGQEFLFRTEVPTSTPEPSSLILFGSGILGLATAIRRKLTR
ncbi:MAG: PEP-CTERM sorting domain-containing protein [Candidatus Korobacteraceae bacterium]|jgi:hypothetical protein